MDRLQTLTELRHRLAMLLERTVRKESDLQIGDVLKRGTSHLGTNLVLAIVRSDEKQLTGGTHTAVLTIGVILAAAFELAALRSDRWAYTSWMPRLPMMAGPSLLPMLQMMMLPPIIFKITSALRR